MIPVVRTIFKEIVVNIDEIGLIAQEIVFAFEDDFNDLGKRKLFEEFFNEYLSIVDPKENLQHYDAIIKLGSMHPEAFGQMVEKMKESSLIAG